MGEQASIRRMGALASIQSALNAHPAGRTRRLTHPCGGHARVRVAAHAPMVPNCILLPQAWRARARTARRPTAAAEPRTSARLPAPRQPGPDPGSVRAAGHPGHHAGRPRERQRLLHRRPGRAGGHRGRAQHVHADVAGDAARRPDGRVCALGAPCRLQRARRSERARPCMPALGGGRGEAGGEPRLERAGIAGTFQQGAARRACSMGYPNPNPAGQCKAYGQR